MNRVTAWLEPGNTVLRDMKQESIVFTNDNCIGCNKCIKVCSAVGACISKEEDGKARIIVDGSKCVSCGSCIDVCVHGAREFEDDTERFFKDLEKGERISLLLAPAFKANYPERYGSILGGLKKLGVNRIISVSFGADITSWGYINYMEKYGFTGGISQPCPAVVSYIERYIPELIGSLFPVQSPLMCAAIYCRNELKITDKFAFISPCIAKKLEIEDPHNEGLVQYNVTFEHLISYIDEHDISGPSAHSEIEYGLGSFYPTPGGLAETVRWFLGDQIFIRQIEGERRLYEWLHQNTERIKNKETPFLFIDALNCEKGCICGTAVDPAKSKTDDALYALLKIREESKKTMSGDAWSIPDSPKERLKNYNRQFEGLKLEDYLRGYTDLSEECRYDIPGEEELEKIFVSMNKLTKESRAIDCTCCGYESCAQMATAIYNGFNHRENCIYYEKTMVHELEIEKEQAEEATRQKSAFLANMSHEIRTPINAVLGMDEMIIRETGEDYTRQYAVDIQRSGNMLLSLVNDVLDFSKIESGKMELLPSEYDIVALFSDLEEMVRQGIHDKGLQFEVAVDERIPRYLVGDVARLKQCILNLLTNAKKYTEKGEVRFSAVLEEADEAKARIRIRVDDTGIGIRPEDIEKLFTAFERLDQDRNRTIEGTGLGMNIVQRLLDMMDSRLEVESEYGKGSCFSFSLVQKIHKNEPIGDYAAAVRRLYKKHSTYTQSFTAPEASVLIVDDTKINLTVAKGLLKKTLMRVDTAESGEEALELMKKNVYDILLFDHMMPEMDGIELLYNLKRQVNNPNRDKPCIILTANAVSGAREEYLKNGFDDYMAKPIGGVALEKLLKKYLPPDKVLSAKDIRPQEQEEEAEWAQESDTSLSIEGLDVDEAVKVCGSMDVYMAALEIFYESIGETVQELNGFYDRRDLPGYRIKIHALKSGARMIGAYEFGDWAQKLEEAAKAGDFNYIRDVHGDFIEEYKKFGNSLKNVVK